LIWNGEQIGETHTLSFIQNSNAPTSNFKIVCPSESRQKIPGRMSSYSDITRGNLDLSVFGILELWEGIIGFYPEVH